MKSIQFTPTFVQTKNVRTFNSLMDGLLAGRGDRGDERLACVSGRAGRGKTRTVQTWAARNGAPYLETVSVWTDLDFLRALCAELGVRQVPHRRGTCCALFTRQYGGDWGLATRCVMLSTLCAVVTVPLWLMVTIL